MRLDIMYGTMLGDAFMSKLPCRGVNRQLCYEHSKKQLDYVLYKATQIGLPFKVYFRDRFDKRTNKTYYSVVIHHMANPLFNILYQEFYQETKKIITMNVLDKLTPSSIAIWYCDDGNLYMNKDTKILTLSTEGYDILSRKNIIDYFFDMHSLEFKETNNGAIRLTSLRKIEQFMGIFGEYIPDCMQYKFTAKKHTK